MVLHAIQKPNATFTDSCSLALSCKQSHPANMAGEQVEGPPLPGHIYPPQQVQQEGLWHPSGKELPLAEPRRHAFSAVAPALWSIIPRIFSWSSYGFLESSVRQKKRGPQRHQENSAWRPLFLLCYYRGSSINWNPRAKLGSLLENSWAR